MGKKSRTDRYELISEKAHFIEGWHYTTYTDEDKPRWVCMEYLGDGCFEDKRKPGKALMASVRQIKVPSQECAIIDGYQAIFSNDSLKRDGELPC